MLCTVSGQTVNSNGGTTFDSMATLKAGNMAH